MFWSQLVFKKRQGCYSGCFNIPQLRDHLVCEVSQFWLMFLFLFWWFSAHMRNGKKWMTFIENTQKKKGTIHNRLDVLFLYILIVFPLTLPKTHYDPNQHKLHIVFYARRCPRSPFARCTKLPYNTTPIWTLFL